MKYIISALGGLLLIFTLLTVSGCRQQPKVDSEKPSASKSAKTSADINAGASLSGDDTAVLDRINRSLAAVAETVKPSVVNISTTTTIAMKESPFGDLFNDPFFRRFFGDQYNPHNGKKKYKTSALGSGVIVSDEGYILTNNHVVQNVDEIKVILHDKKEFTGKLIGTDPQTDLAIIKVKAKGLPAIRIGNSDNLKVGELVIAVGNPFALGNTITMGIVSAVGRSHVGIADYEDFIQTDAAINPGNSGGALVNIRAELIGINTAIFSTSGGNVGIGFAIPSAMAKSVMDSIISKGRVVRGWLGVSIQDLTSELSEHFDIKKEEGSLVADVVQGAPADKAGIRRGDLIISFEGTSVKDSAALRNMVAGRQPGTVVKLIILRGKKEITISVTLGELPKTRIAEKSEYNNVMDGISIQTLTPDIRLSLEIPENVTGVIVTTIDEESPAAEALRENDVIQELNKKAIRNMKEYENAVSKVKPGDKVLLLVYRDGGYLYITLNP